MKTADLTFTEDGTPFSVSFDDFYYSSDGGLAESHFVFIEQNNLTARFQNLAPCQSFTIAESGFGTGLNFFATWQHFLKHAPTDSKLTFVSCEKHPIKKDQFIQAHKQWSQLKDYSDQYIEDYPQALSGHHLLEFDRVCLILIYDDVSTAFANMNASVDAWFLDGFSPSKNPDMWQPNVFKHMQRQSHYQTTFSTFTSARIVCDGLFGAGFRVQKKSGLGKKRHISYGRFLGLNGPHPIKGWPSSELPAPKANLGNKIAIIGAGISGTTTAIELKKHGYDVTLFDKAPGPAQGGSGNIQGAVYAKLSAQPTAANVFYAQALITAQKELAKLPEEVPHQSCGLVQLVHDDRALKQLNNMSDSDYIPQTLVQIKTASELTELIGISVEDSGLWFPDGGWVSPVLLINYLIDHHDIHCQWNWNVNKINLTEHGWTISNTDGSNQEFDQVVITNAVDALNLEQSQHLPLNPIAGQVTQLEQTDEMVNLKSVICTDRYVMPPFNNQLTIGSTFRLKSTETDIRLDDHNENIESLKTRLPNWLKENLNISNGRAGVRCTSPDYLPLVGAISDPSKLAEQFSLPVQKNRAIQQPPATHISGLWINVAHGSKGLCSTPLCARLLAAMISGQPLPVSQKTATTLNPNRFEIRKMAKAQRKKS